jgi:hypothetical protein
MGKGTRTFRETDVARAVRGARKAGLDIAAVRVEQDGAIEIVVGGKAAAGPASDTDGELAEFEAHRHG